MRNVYRLPLCLSLALILGSVAPAVADTPANPTASNTDAVLTQELQKEFSDHLEFRSVVASVDDRIATLQGSVENYRDKLEAEKLARQHRKIEGLRDYITVVPIVNVPDSELQNELADRLRYDRIGYGIQFNNLELAVKDGVVTVRGEVRTYPDKESALAIVEETPGVREVRDELRVLPLSSYDDDLRLRAAKAIYGDPVLSKYALDPQAPIRIVVEDGHVKLYGVVDSDMDRHIAELRANGAAGVLGVENHLVVGNPREEKVAENAKPGAASPAGSVQQK